MLHVYIYVPVHKTTHAPVSRTFLVIHIEVIFHRNFCEPWRSIYRRNVDATFFIMIQKVSEQRQYVIVYVAPKMDNYFKYLT